MIDPFLAYPDKGVILLCRTSTPAATTGGSAPGRRARPAAAVRHRASGADRVEHPPARSAWWWRHLPAEIARVREIALTLPLSPGRGRWGGDAEATVRAGLTAQGTIVVNSSRAVLYASCGEDSAEAARRVAMATCDQLAAAARA